MSERFVDNVTLLNAYTLNNLEDDLRNYSYLPIYNGEYDSSYTTGHCYRINDENFSTYLKVGYVFVFIPDTSSNGNSNKIVSIGYSNFTYPMYPNNLNIIPSVGTGQLTVNNDRYLVAGRPYLVKCFAKIGNNYQLIITEMYNQVPIPAANQNSIGGIKIYVDGTTLHINTN